jgi:hypothetical protein
MHKFVILINGELITYSNYDDIPQEFDNIIEFIPEIPDGPHTDEQHKEIEQWNNKLHELLKREKQ